MNDARSVQASPANKEGLTPAQIEAWRKQGVVLVSELLPASLIESLRCLAEREFPAPGSEAALAVRDFGSGGRFVFPSKHAEFNQLTLHKALIKAVAVLLDIEPMALRLTQSDLWPKYGHTTQDARDNQDQRIHMDYPNHMLVHPPSWHSPAAVELIIYFSDARDCAGETGFISRHGDEDPAYQPPYRHSPGMGEHPFINDRLAAEHYFREQAPEVAAFRAGLYEREQIADFRPGDVLFYRHDVWHRGRPLTSGSMRLAQNLSFRRADADWISLLHPGWSWSMYHPEQRFERWLASASVLERTVLGFPAPGHPYWTRETLAGVTARYAPFGFDPAPYEQAI